MSRESKTSVKKKSSKSPSRSESPSTPSTTMKKKPSANEGDRGGEYKDDGLGPQVEVAAPLDGIELPPTPPSTTGSTTKMLTTTTLGSETSGTALTQEIQYNSTPSVPKGPLERMPSEDLESPKVKKKKEASHKPKKGGGGTPRGGHQGSKSHRGEMKFGERPSRIRESMGDETHPSVEGGDEHVGFDPSKFQRMTALYFHKHNDLSRSARGVGYTPNQAVSQYGPGVTEEAESLYGPCRLLTDFKYSTWTETVVPLRNHNVVQGFNEMILFLIKLAANPDGPVNHEEAFMATSFLANIRNDLGEHPPNVLALLEYIDSKTLDDGTEPADPEMEVITPCKASERY